MPASTVAITENPTVKKNTFLALDPDSKPSIGRRQVVVAKSKSTAGVVVDGGSSSSNSDKVAAHGKDLGCTRGEAVLERTQELPQPNKSPIEESTVPARRKKSAWKPQKPSWKTVVSIVLSNGLLLTVALSLGWIIWRYGDQLFNSDEIPFPDMPFSVADFEGRISDALVSLKATEKMMQVELENLDRKLASDVDDLRSELIDQIEEKNELFGKELEKLEGKVDSFGKSLRDSSFFTQEEFGKLWNNVRGSQCSYKEGKKWSLDEIHVHAREAIMREIERHAADGLGRVDYALASGGARVVRHSEPYDFKKGSWLPIVKVRSRVHANAHKMLEPSFGEPGRCFPLRGNTGFVEIKLRAAIILDSVTLEHVAKTVAYDRSSAPRDCRISAWLEPPGAGSVPAAGVVGRMLTVMQFTYDLEKSNAQTFNMATADAGVVNVVRLDFSSNHGSSSHTCIYRLRVHGYDPKSLVTMAVEA